MISEVRARTILGRSSIGDYCINPYIGCQHACVYCYAQFYAKRWGHEAPWGSYVGVKVNAPDLLKRELSRKERGVVYISSMTDPYQPAERRYEITRRILEVLAGRNWPIILQTKSPLVLRDRDLLRGFSQVKVGLTVITLSEEVRAVMEPFAPRIEERIQALEELRSSGIGTFAFLGPILPGTKVKEVLELINALKGVADVLYLDRLNLKPGLKDKLDKAFSKLGIEGWDKGLDHYYNRLKVELSRELRSMGVRHVFVY